MSLEPDNLRDEVPAPLQRGTNQAGMRAQNERLVLSLVRRHGPLAKSEIARMTGLSAQTVSVIMRHLESDRLIRRGEPQRGRVGQPLVPLSLDPEGAFFLGAKVGRRSLEVVLVDFVGGIRHRAAASYPYPTPRDTIRRIRAEVAACEALLGADAGRIAGLGIAMPFELWAGPRRSARRRPSSRPGARPTCAPSWRGCCPGRSTCRTTPPPPAAPSSPSAGNGGLRDFIYFYVGAFVGGGLVLNGGLFAGRTGNAAALGSMPVPDGAGGSVQLIDLASLVLLERRLRAARLPLDALYDPAADWTAYAAHLDGWLAGAARGIAHAVAAASAIIDFEAAVIDGAFPAPVRERLITAIAAELDRLDLSGLDRPELRPGSIGPIARALGGASLPLFDRYLVDQHTLAGPAPRRSAEAV